MCGISCDTVEIPLKLCVAPLFEHQSNHLPTDYSVWLSWLEMHAPNYTDKKNYSNFPLRRQKQWLTGTLILCLLCLEPTPTLISLLFEHVLPFHILLNLIEDNITSY